ncbi:Type II secretion system protein N [Microbulbifer aggregans]|uniref:Type II secretion system protein N n=1 Tax=Microbulbifer aggregans TaxID=1769779 RepID=A0A1C9W9Q4_9GAMM|nr:type II secretion system protein N [Microbulbifer aggregans]AOS97879.1 Type II secretion system protein N [Microbulbifer aggregans]
MSALQRFTLALPSTGNRAFPRSLIASAAVVGVWLLLNVLAYGASLLPSTEEESLLATRHSTGSSARQSASLPGTPFFGVAAVEPTAEPRLDLANIPITQLNLVLSGVLDNSDENKASALVAERGKPAQRLFIGDRLPGGAELYSVDTDHIILRRNGKMEKLTYPDEDGRPSVPLRNFTTSNLGRQAAEVSAESEQNRSEKQQSIRERLEQLRSLARERRAER